MTRFDGDVIVVGAGLIGLAIAFELTERGASVRVFDRGAPGRAASWAGAGMLAPYTERVQNEALLAFCAASLSEYSSFVRRALDAGGVDAQLSLDGVLHAAFDERGAEALRRQARALRARGVANEELDRGATLAEAPWLGAGVAGGLLVRSEGRVDNRRLGRALVAACVARGARVERDASVAVECDSRRVLGVRTGRGFVPARAVVNACGAWSAALPGVPASCLPPVRPVKGQMLALASPAGLVRHATWLPDAYLVPRDDGRLLVGATSEAAGFDERVTADGVHRLLAGVLAVAPALAGFTLTESWAGLRPATPDGLPFLGPTPIEGLFLATGHYRNGILLAPATARAIADLIVDGRSEAIAPFALARAGTEELVAGRMT
jgi:glycine oxidase